MSMGHVYPLDCDAWIIERIKKVGYHFGISSRIAAELIEHHPGWLENGSGQPPSAGSVAHHIGYVALRAGFPILRGPNKGRAMFAQPQAELPLSQVSAEPPPAKPPAVKNADDGKIAVMVREIIEAREILFTRIRNYARNGNLADLKSLVELTESRR